MPNDDKSRRAKLIANPGSGDTRDVTAKLEQVTRYLLDYGMSVDVALAHPIKEIIPIAKKAVKKGYSTVIAMGGDGTISAVIRGIAGSKVHLGIIAAGTENDIATSLGIPEDLKEACALIASDHTRDLDLAQISTKEKKKFIFFMVTTVGLTSTLYPDIKDVPHGDLSNIKDAFMTILHTKPNPKVFLTLDGESRIEVETMLVTVTNTPLIGAKNLVAPDASMQDGLLDVAVYPNFSKAELLAYFAKSAHENITPDGKIQRYRARKIKIKTSPKLDIAAEGILLGKGKAKIKLLPRALKVIAPEPGTGAEPEKLQTEALEELPVPVAIAVRVENHDLQNNGQ
ncbi:MAG TPA: diacylglycerol kinase family protein [Anaerolineales bacterium]|nr:diacylglycerol kinase family protein [Anaerolineales bacterium]HLO32667.1 diacylglycerol kinase family protein [Anaerolineales bacterium]